MNPNWLKAIKPRLITLLVITILLCYPKRLSARGDKASGPLPAESVLISPDRTIYLAGERIYFSATILEADNFTVSGLSKVVRLELINSDGNQVTGDKFLTETGTVRGMLRLQENIPTGWYRLRAYTSWMRNRGAESFARIDLRIINPADASKLDSYVLNDTLSVSILPRGGVAQPGVANRCAIHSITKRGRPVAVNGYLMASRNDTVTRFSTGETGWGVITWIPDHDSDYRIILDTDPGIPVITSIPQYAEKGISVTISDPLPAGAAIRKERDLTVTISGELPAAGVKLLVHRLTTWYLFSEATPQNGEISFVIPTADMPYGLLSFSFLDNDNRTLASSLWVKESQPGRGADVTTSVSSGGSITELITRYNSDDHNKDECFTLITRRREPVEITTLFIPSLPGWPVSWDMPADRSEQEGWLIANSYNDSIAGSFFNKENSSPVVSLVNFNDLSGKREGRVDFLPETRGFIISGKVTREDGSPAAYHVLSLTGLNDNLFAATRTFPSGKFYFTLPGRSGAKDMLLSHTLRSETKLTISIYPEFDTRSHNLPPTHLYLTPEESSYVSQLIIDKKLKEIYVNAGSGQAPDSETRRTDKRLFYGTPDQIILIDDYIRLPDMREVIFEVVPTVSVRKEGDDFSMRVTRETPFPKMYNPLILLDDIPLLSFKEFLELPPDRFRRIDIMNSLYIHGNQVFAGVVNFISVNGDLAGLDLPGGSRIVSTGMPVADHKGELVNNSPTEGDLPLLDVTITFQQPDKARSGNIYYRGNPVFGDYITILNGINDSGKWLNATSYFSIPMSEKVNR